MIGIDVGGFYAVALIDGPCSAQLSAEGIHCFASPSRERAVDHPSNSYGWMLHGEALYRELESSAIPCSLACRPAVPSASKPSPTPSPGTCAAATPARPTDAASGSPCRAYGDAATGLIVVPEQPHSTEQVPDWSDWSA